MTKVPSGEFRFTSISSVVFGTGSVQRISEIVDDLGARHALLVTGQTLATKTNLVERIKSMLGDKCAGVFSGVLQHVPRQCVIEGARTAKETRADILVSLGGSSAADAAKGMNLVLAQGRKIDDFFTKLDNFRYECPDADVATLLKRPNLHQIAIPTTLSGGEFTASVGITDKDRKQKGGFRNPELTPRVVILDPEMTVYTSRELWASTGLKALSSCFEGICSPRHQPFADALILRATHIINKHLTRSIAEPFDLGSRAMLQQAVWMNSYAMRGVGTGIIAALRHQIGGIYGIAHGIASTIVFPHAVDFNRPIIDDRLDLLARALDMPINDADDSAVLAITRVRELIRDIGLPARLRDVGLPKDGLQIIAKAAMEEHAIQNNPRPIKSMEQLLGVLEQAW